MLLRESVATLLSPMLSVLKSVATEGLELVRGTLCDFGKAYSKKQSERRLKEKLVSSLQGIVQTCYPNQSQLVQVFLVKVRLRWHLAVDNVSPIGTVVVVLECAANNFFFFVAC
jgi:hypothetical protein